MSDPVWWAKHYQSILLDLASRVRQYLSGDLDEGILLAFLDGLDTQLGESE